MVHVSEKGNYHRNIPENTANGIEYINPANNSLGNRVKNRASDD
jgi:hypothetical protein